LLLVGYSTEELTALSFEDITHPEDIEKNRDLAAKMFQREINSYRLQKRHIRKNGEIIWINLTASVIRESEGSPVYGPAMIPVIAMTHVSS
jgi:PAS domain S-box-containing protein